MNPSIIEKLYSTNDSGKYQDFRLWDNFVLSEKHLRKLHLDSCWIFEFGAEQYREEMEGRQNKIHS